MDDLRGLAAASGVVLAAMMLWSVVLAGLGLGHLSPFRLLAIEPDVRQLAHPPMSLRATVGNAQADARAALAEVTSGADRLAQVDRIVARITERAMPARAVGPSDAP